MQCDGESPCKRCLALVSLSNERKVLSFSECIRSRIQDINIYSDGEIIIDQICVLACSFLTSGGPSGLIKPVNSTGFKLNFSAAEPSIQERIGNINVEFSKEAVDPSQLSSILAMARDWIVDAKNPQRMTLVDTLCSPSLKPVISDALGPEVATAFHGMLHATPLAHGYYILKDTTTTDTMQVMWRNGHSAAFSVLERLDRLLTPANLARLPIPTGQALFIVIFGALIAVDYASGVVQPTLSPPDAEKLNFPSPNNFWELMRQHLRQVLAHYLVYLGDRLGQRFDPDLERQVLQRGIHGFSDNKIRILWTNRARIGGSGPAPRRDLALRHRGTGTRGHKTSGILFRRAQTHHEIQYSNISPPIYASHFYAPPETHRLLQDVAALDDRYVSKTPNFPP